MNLELQIAKRYLFSKKSTNAINIISLVSGLAMLFGTMALLLVLSVFNGLEGLIKSLYTVFYADVAIMPAEGKSFEITPKIQQQLNSISYIDAYSFMLEENALLEYGDRQHICTIRGVDSNYFNVIPKFDSFIIDGKKVLVQDSINYAIIGVGVALKLGMNAAQSFEPLSIYMPKKTSSSFSSMENAFNKSYINTSSAFAVSDEFDSRYSLVPISFFQDLTENENKASQIAIRLKNEHQSKDAILLLKQKLGKAFVVKSRYEQNEVLYKILKSEKWITFAILIFIMIIASFNIIGALSMLVLEKKKDIATLTALGLQKNSIVKLFLLEGILMSCIGACIGMLFAFIICIVQDKIGLIPMPGSSFLVQYYPVKMLFTDFLAVGVVVILISVIAAYLPAKKAASAVEKEYLSYLS
ncbi:MAG TPA: FtsX-like permease family protein [Chitinophagales bacterium]|jgi:lipoprotein-releasing system permease protein|nr:ABC transporter permease [Chitinophagales bacterium]HQV77917.1 FtsX-like permease family protein [Chitinophagales bacterium]HQW78639.1 FtsX-like permease family protein [Chitinophagales bacterium]